MRQANQICLSFWMQRKRKSILNNISTNPEKEKPTDGSIEGNLHDGSSFTIIIDEDKTKEAWTMAKMSRSKTSFAPMLAVIGKFCWETWREIDFFSEKKVVPMSVLSAFFVYFGIAAAFYFE